MLTSLSSLYSNGNRFHRYIGYPIPPQVETNRNLPVAFGLATSAAKAEAEAEVPLVSLLCCGGSGVLLRLGGGLSRWSAVSVTVVCYARGDRSDPQVSFLSFYCSFHHLVLA